MRLPDPQPHTNISLSYFIPRSNPDRTHDESFTQIDHPQIDDALILVELQILHVRSRDNPCTGKHPREGTFESSVILRKNPELSFCSVRIDEPRMDLQPTSSTRAGQEHLPNDSSVF